MKLIPISINTMFTLFTPLLLVVPGRRVEVVRLSENSEVRIDGDGVVEPEHEKEEGRVSWGLNGGRKEGEGGKVGETKKRGRNAPKSEVESTDGLQFLGGKIELDVVEVLGDEFWEVGFLRSVGRRGGRREVSCKNEAEDEKRREREGGGKTNGDDSDSLLSRPSKKDLGSSYWIERVTASERANSDGRGKGRETRRTLLVSLRNSSDESVLEEGSGVLVPSDLDKGSRSERAVGGNGDAELLSEVDEGSAKKRRRVEVSEGERR